MSTVQCPNCQKQVEWSPASPYRPFCSERCKLLDLGAWADGSYAIPTDSGPNDVDGEEDKLDNQAASLPNNREI